MLDGRFELRAVEPTPEALIPAFRECTVFIDASMKVPISGADIAAAENLKLIITATTGATHIDQDALSEANIPMLTLKGQTEFLPWYHASGGTELGAGHGLRPQVTRSDGSRCGR